MARPGVCRAASSAVLWGGPDDDEGSLDCGGWCCCSQPRRSDCRFLGRPGLHRVGERRRLLPVGATGSGSAEVVVDVAVDIGEVTRGLTWRVSPGEAGRVRRRGRMGADEEVEEASWGTVVEGLWDSSSGMEEPDSWWDALDGDVEGTEAGWVDDELGSKEAR